MDMTRFRVEPGRPAGLDGRPTDDVGDFDGGKAAGRERTAALVARLSELQRMLYAERRHRVLLILQAPDAGGKDGTISTVFTGVNPQGVRVVSFKQPNDEDLAHDYLWRIHRHTPGRGEITVFNRSHYEDVLVVRVHGLVPEVVWRRRFDHLNDFERMLTDEGTTIVKVYLHLSEQAQAERFQDRLDDPAKHWKFRSGDLADRARWGDFRAAYEEALSRTSTASAPWHVVPADRTWFRNLVVAELLVQTMEGLDLRYPPPEPGLDTVRLV